MSSTYTAEAAIYSGDLYVARLDADGIKQGYLLLGNANSFKFDAPSIEKKTLPSKMRATRGQDLAVLIDKQTKTLGFTLTDISRKNLALAFFGTDADASQTGASVTDEVVTGFHDKWSALAKTNVSSVVVTDSAGTTTYDVDDDYVVNADDGMIWINPDGAITDGQSLKADYTYASTTAFKIEAYSDTQIDVAILLLGKNAIDDSTWRIEVPKVTLEPSAAFEVLSDDFATMDFKGTIITTTEPSFTIKKIEVSA
ncbi:hypothetical protein MCHI_002208 [Candidatus Magnetoovum chiemensis]|nr:hypothetical protein MCHI_002208 [Candidatus Magnetoovum chiemensis]